ncbi:MAG: TIGR02646 family protein [Tannerellaceae bacterium]|jgi:uncharacterized protein (TIGR02646 family)|nr:TIGR02646 family protein [Tannerellaceae bacterium]
MKRNPDPPSFYTNYIRRQKPQQWDDIAPVRKDLRNHLWSEQGGICAYTEIRLPGSDHNCHIDHYKTRHLFPELIFDYHNLLVSCNSENYGAKYKDKRIKSKKEYEYLVNPVDESFADHIEYAMSGELVAINGSAKGEYTITTFNLNGKSLIERRRIVIDCLRQMIDYSEDDAVKDIGEFESMVHQLYHERESLLHGENNTDR